jgi:hypothetical protein
MAREVGEVLGEIFEDEHRAGRPMLSAVVVPVRLFRKWRRSSVVTLGPLRRTKSSLENGTDRVYQEWAS